MVACLFVWNVFQPPCTCHVQCGMLRAAVHCWNDKTTNERTNHDGGVSVGRCTGSPTAMRTTVPLAAPTRKTSRAASTGAGSAPATPATATAMPTTPLATSTATSGRGGYSSQYRRDIWGCCGVPNQSGLPGVTGKGLQRREASRRWGCGQPGGAGLPRSEETPHPPRTTIPQVTNGPCLTRGGVKRNIKCETTPSHVRDSACRVLERARASRPSLNRAMLKC